MGLDMYLNRRLYTDEYDGIEINLSADLDYINPKNIHYIIERVAYWRKANQIHNWFVENVQGGQDDCGEYFVSRDDLVRLLDVCQKVKESCNLTEGVISNGKTFIGGVAVPILASGFEIDNPEICKELLPTAEGFFFGSTDYDQYYYDDIVYTVDTLSKLLEHPGNGTFYYSSSW